MSPITHVGILGLVAVAACWSLAVVVYRVSVAGSVARKLAHLLVIEGIVLVSAGFPEMAFSVRFAFYNSYPLVTLFSSLVHHLGDAAMISLYPAFLALALKTNMTSRFEGKRARFGLAILAVIFALAVVFTSSRIVQTLFYSFVTLLFLYALFVSIHAWRTATSGIVRERAGIFALAFGLRDLGWVVSYGIFAWIIWTDVDLIAVMDAPQMTEELGTILLAKGIYALGTLVAVPLIAYGILRAQLFDIDLRIRWTIKQSTLAGIFMALMFLISEGASTFLSAELGNVAGLLAAAMVMFFLSPLQRFADRVAGAAMPNTKNTPEYISYRKMKVFEGALAEALQEGGISNKERSLLNHLRDSLEISSADAEALENELAEAGKAL